MRQLITNFSQHVGTEVEISGWVYNSRSSGKIAFLQVRDGSGFTQAIVSKAEVDASTWEAAESIPMESSVVLTGVVSKHPKKDEYELQVKTVVVLHRAQEYPISKKEHGPDFLLNHRHLWLRSPSQWAIQRVRNSIINATYDYFAQNNYIKIDAPILTPTSCEDTTELFELDYFSGESDTAEANSSEPDVMGKGASMGVETHGRKAYLTQSGQLYIEAAIFAHGRVFDFGPVFRAEKSKTRRHLTEFWMMDAEHAFVDYVGNMDIQEGLVRFIVQYVLEHNQYELALLERNIPALQACLKPFARITHADAVAQLQKMGSDITADDDLGADDETMLTKLYDTPLFVMKYPAKIKAFYMKPDPEDPTRALCADLLAPEGYGEIIGGSERIADYDLLVQRLADYNLPRAPFEWYLDLRRYGSVPHSGFGYGLERLTAWICGLQHIRETIPFPRMINRLNP